MQTYKQDLDGQINQRVQMKAYGNMTNVEKEMNRDDLHAYKKFDDKQYGMIPGFGSQKRLAEVRPAKHTSPVGLKAKA